MCGFAGFLALKSDPENLVFLGKMQNSLVHRGPDSEGQWTDPARGVFIGFRRLAIVDLSQDGAQPMKSADGRWIIAFNGEIYNFKALRLELEALGHSFRGHSDTAVLLGAISHWGLQEALVRANGMFAFALWDREQNKLFLGRDRMGEKPLYYGWNGSFFYFGSELKALRAHPHFQEELSTDALCLFLRFSYIPAPYSIAKDVFKLEPGKILELSATGKREDPTIRSFWSPWESFQRQSLLRTTESREQQANHLKALLQDAIRLRMQVDVPIGAFLSGGIDSSLVVALMQELCPRPVSTFTIGFTENAFNEAPFARSVAQHLGSNHTELFVAPEDARAVIPLLPTLYDEPFADASQIPTYLVSKLARTSVTVSLSGDGGDELFGGYQRHAWIQKLRRLRTLPWPAPALVGASLRVLSPLLWERLVRANLPILRQLPLSGQRIQKLSSLLTSPSMSGIYETLVRQWKSAEVLKEDVKATFPALEKKQWPPGVSDAEKTMYLDAVTYLPDDILVKLDRASMAVSLEARVPFLDPRIVEYAWRLPLSSKIQGTTGKVLLRDLLARYVPVALFNRPKAGFAIPLEAWVRGPLRDWAEDQLSERRLKDSALFDTRAIRSCWSEHVSEKTNHINKLWSLLMFQAWQESTCR